jgi:hypothetical protein
MVWSGRFRILLMLRARNTANACRRSLSATPPPDGSAARRAEVCRQAFACPGGRRGASVFLDRFDADPGDKPANIAMTSGIGMLMVSSRMQPHASIARSATGDAFVPRDGT